MTVKISNKIVGYRVKKADAETPNENQAPVQAETKPVEMNEYIERPDFLLGTTYKIKLPVAEHAMYITRSEEHTSELQSRPHLVCRLLLEKKKKTNQINKMTA